MLAVCLNPAWQKTLFFDNFATGTVNRAFELRECGGGKGVNVARALRILGEPVQVALFAGGLTGDLLLAELKQEGSEPLVVPTQGATRTCVTVIDNASGQVTEIIEPSEAIRPKEMTAMKRLLREAAAKADGVAICGTFPPGVPETCYADIVQAAREAGKPVLLDSYRQVRPALAAGPTILKINAEELRHLSGRVNLEDAAFDSLTQYPLQMLAVTDGPRPAFLFTRRESWQFDQPSLSVRSAIGAGDCATAIMLRDLIAGAPPQEAFRHALAAANASCLTEQPCRFVPKDVDALRAQIKVTKL
jgi:tagatose 6-phosphate kinase